MKQARFCVLSIRCPGHKKRTTPDDRWLVRLLVAGLAGMAGAHSSTDQIAEYWSCISVHLFLMSCYNLDSKLFFAGCILECMLSYLLLAG